MVIRSQKVTPTRRTLLELDVLEQRVLPSLVPPPLVATNLQAPTADVRSAQLASDIATLPPLTTLRDGEYLGRAMTVQVNVEPTSVLPTEKVVIGVRIGNNFWHKADLVPGMQTVTFLEGGTPPPGAKIEVVALTPSQAQTVSDWRARAQVTNNWAGLSLNGRVLESHTFTLDEERAQLSRYEDLVRTDIYQSDVQTAVLSRLGAGWRVDRIFSDAATNAYGLGVIGPNGQALLLLRGSTLNSKDWLANIDPRGVGYAQYTALKDRVSGWATQVAGTTPLVVLGQSQAGAEGQLHALNLAKLNIKTTLRTFNSTGIARAELTQVTAEQLKLIDAVHQVTTGDVVSTLGEVFVPGRVYNADVNSVVNKHMAKTIIDDGTSRLTVSATVADLNDTLVKAEATRQAAASAGVVGATAQSATQTLAATTTPTTTQATTTTPVATGVPPSNSPTAATSIVGPVVDAVVSAAANKLVTSAVTKVADAVLPALVSSTTSSLPADIAGTVIQIAGPKTTTSPVAAVVQTVVSNALPESVRPLANVAIATITGGPVAGVVTAVTQLPPVQKAIQSVAKVIKRWFRW